MQDALRPRPRPVTVATRKEPTALDLRRRFQPEPAWIGCWGCTNEVLAGRPGVGNVDSASHLTLIVAHVAIDRQSLPL